MPVVLTTNEVVANPDHRWDDVEGVQYHYPNGYKNKIKTGDQFIYYRGVNRASGRREQAEYFGHGTIGKIWQDPKTRESSRPSWYCAIEDYIPFSPPVPAKPNGTYYEDIPANMWRNGVRSLDHEVFDRIIAAAGQELDSDGLDIKRTSSPAGAVESNDLIVPPKKQTDATRAGGAGGRRSKISKKVGDWAELAALDFIAKQLKATSIVHRAAQNETPGWDIDYEDASGVQRVEVKGTVAAAFVTVDLTANELHAAEQHGETYWLFLVVNCLTDRKKIMRIRNPWAKIKSGEWNAKPTTYNIEFG